MKELIQNFVKSGNDTIDLGCMVPINEIKLYLMEIGFDELEFQGEETNGWQVDFWYTFNSNEYGSYTLIGSLFYGDFKLTKD